MDTGMLQVSWWQQVPHLSTTVYYIQQEYRHRVAQQVLSSFSQGNPVNSTIQGTAILLFPTELEIQNVEAGLPPFKFDFPWHVLQPYNVF